ncbi:hypothetical protein CTI14_37830, partial [Methylobacterium radiotolerans]
RDRGTAYLLIDGELCAAHHRQATAVPHPHPVRAQHPAVRLGQGPPRRPAVALLGEKATPEAIARVNELYGFNKPLIEQYFIWVTRLLQGDFGTSIQTNRPVTEEFLRRFPATIELSVAALIFAIGVGIPLGYWAARRHGKFTDHASVVLSLIGITIPVFFLAFILKYVFAVQLGWLPSTPAGSPDRCHPSHRLLCLGRIITGEFDAAWDAILHLILPALALGTSRSRSSSASPGRACWRCRTPTTCARGGRRAWGRRRCASRFILRNAHAAGHHDDRPADRTARSPG